MPEIAEVARIVHFIRTHLVNKTLAQVSAADDGNVFGKVGTSGAEFQKALLGRKIVGAGQQGKYFWLEMDRGPHPLMHFGMTGWLKLNGAGVDTYYYRKKEGDEDEVEWPPRFWKFHIETKEKPVVQAAFVDSRRFARIRLMDCKVDQIRKISPLKDNGPDPVVDKDRFTPEYLTTLCRKKRIPIKALLLDQSNVSGIGNWVGDEVMYNARMHPEQYSNTLSDAQLAQLHKSILYVCETAVDLLADSDKFPEDWLFKHRWGKGKKGSENKMPNGEKITFITVGGRTSAIVPSLQKKTGPVAGDVGEAETKEKPKKGKKTESKATQAKAKPAAEIENEKASKKRKSTTVKDEDDDTDDTESEPSAPVTNGTTTKTSAHAHAPDPAPPAKRARKGKSSTSDAQNARETEDAESTSMKTKPGKGKATTTPAPTAKTAKKTTTSATTLASRAKASAKAKAETESKTKPAGKGSKKGESKVQEDLENSSGRRRSGRLSRG